MKEIKQEDLKFKDIGQIMDLHEDMKKTLQIVNEWLYRLSDEDRRKFVSSYDFVIFKNTLKKINKNVNLEDIPPQQIKKSSKEDMISKLRGVFKL